MDDNYYLYFGYWRYDRSGTEKHTKLIFLRTFAAEPQPKSQTVFQISCCHAQNRQPWKTVEHCLLYKGLWYTPGFLPYFLHAISSLLFPMPFSWCAFFLEFNHFLYALSANGHIHAAVTKPSRKPINNQSSVIIETSVFRQGDVLNAE